MENPSKNQKFPPIIYVAYRKNNRYTETVHFSSPLYIYTKPYKHLCPIQSTLPPTYTPMYFMIPMKAYISSNMRDINHIFRIESFTHSRDAKSYRASDANFK